MELELSYLSEKIDDIDYKIDLCEYGIDIGCSDEEEKEALIQEKQILENILNKLTEIELIK